MDGSGSQHSGAWALEDPLFNKGTAFTEQERSALGLRGLLPSVVETLDQQVARSYQAFREQPSDIARHINLRALQDTNETLFYRLVTDHADEMLPILYTPTSGWPASGSARSTGAPAGCSSPTRTATGSARSSATARGARST